MYVSKLETVRSGAGEKMKVISKKISIFGNVYFLLLDIQMHPFSRRPCFLSFSLSPSPT